MKKISKKINTHIWTPAEIIKTFGEYIGNILMKKKEDCTDEELEIQKIYKNVRIF